MVRLILPPHAAPHPPAPSSFPFWLLPFPHRHLDRLRLSAAEDLHWRRLADDLTGQVGKQLVVIDHGVVVDPHQDIADDQPARSGRTIVLNPDQEQPMCLVAPEGLLEFFAVFKLIQV